jgi:hypothetical protein
MRYLAIEFKTRTCPRDRDAFFSARVKPCGEKPEYAINRASGAANENVWYRVFGIIGNAERLFQSRYHPDLFGVDFTIMGNGAGRRAITTRNLPTGITGRIESLDRLIFAFCAQELSKLGIGKVVPPVGRKEYTSTDYRETQVDTASFNPDEDFSKILGVYKIMDGPDQIAFFLKPL